MFGIKKLKDEIARLERLRVIDKETIWELIELLSKEGVAVGGYGWSLVTQSLEQ